MLLTLDESGKDGLKPSQGRSPWLVIGGPLFPDRAASDACQAALKELHQVWGGKEFHFTHDSDDRKRVVLTCLAQQRFNYYAATYRREVNPGPRWRQKKPADLYHAVAGFLLTTVVPPLADCTVWFDAMGGRSDNTAYRNHLRKMAGRALGGKNRIAECASKRSEDELLVQVADYICGAIARSLHPSRATREFADLIARRRGQVKEWTATASAVPIVEPPDTNEGGGPLTRPASSE